MITILERFLEIFNWLLAFLTDLKEKLFGGPTIELDSGVKVRIGRELAQGGYSVVYKGINVRNPNLVYAVKRIHCHDDPELRSACVEEANVHRTLQKLQDQEMHCMPLHGMTFEENNTICYMVFPYMPHSLRQEVNQRVFYPSAPQSRAPWSESVALTLLAHLCEGVALMHNRAQLTHRDIKLENILFQGSNTMHLQSPVIMDFGSAGPLKRKLENRKDILEIAEEAGQHTTMPYRPPELFPGELRVGDEDLDYTKVDVWSLGCTFFAILYGGSPFECEFKRGNLRRTPGTIKTDGPRKDTAIQIVECSQLRVLGNIPKPHPSTPAANWYSPQVMELVEFILQKDRMQRPTLQQLQIRVQALLKGEAVDVEDPMDSLLSTKRHNAASW
jgi:serine/threonine kinase 16